MGEPFKLSDQKSQNAVINELKKEGIPFQVDDRGFVNYLLTDQAKVDGIQRTILYGPSLDQNHFESIVLVNDYERKKYEKGFSESGIPYSIVTYQGQALIEYSQSYGPKVDLIKQQLDIEIMDHYIKAAK